MISLLALALAASAPHNPTAAPMVQAQATVRIVYGVRLKLDGKANPDAPLPRAAELRSGGEIIPARLIEFQ
ncbi:MAG: hypothetical protein ABIO80_09795 [Sphingomicrobium sp.]